jgi:hypothetical protein
VAGAGLSRENDRKLHRSNEPKRTTGAGLLRSTTLMTMAPRTTTSHQGSYAPVTAIPVSNDDPLAERFVGAVTAETVSTEAMPYLEVVAPASLPEVSSTCITLLV